jgi:hypothetical protein
MENPGRRRLGKKSVSFILKMVHLEFPLDMWVEIFIEPEASESKTRKELFRNGCWGLA